MSGSNTGMGKMHLDLYTNNAALTQKARFWCNFVSSLKGEFDGQGVEREREDGVRDARPASHLKGLRNSLMMPITLVGSNYFIPSILNH